MDNRISRPAPPAGVPGRILWLASGGAAAMTCAALRKWQLSSAFEPSGLSIPHAPASTVLACVLVMAAAWFTILAVSQKLSRAGRWDQLFLGAGSPVYPVLILAAAFAALAACPILLKNGVELWTAYRQAVAMKADIPSNNGALVIGAAVGALLSCLGLLAMAQAGARPGRRGKGGLSAALPGTVGCVWLMESFRAHASNPERWEYAPLLLAIVAGMLMYLDFASLSGQTARPRRLLWLSAAALTLSAAALPSALADGAWGDALLLGSQSLSALAVLWQMPPGLEQAPRQSGASRPQKSVFRNSPQA